MAGLSIFFKCTSYLIHLPANEISYNIGMANKNFITVCSLFWISSVDIFSKGSLNSSSILEKLLKNRILKNEINIVNHYIHLAIS